MSGHWFPVYIGVGSNIEDPRAQVLRAVDTLRAFAPEQFRVIAVSPLYGTKPFGPIPQPDFVNGAVGALTQLDPLALLKRLKQIEAAMGRPAQREKWGPRIIDLDLLLYGREQLRSPELTLPHPGIVERNFVLYPLADIAPDLDVPGLGRVAELKRRVAQAGIWPLESASR
ncbi:MAG TPA: 2-amino-4-hydroxy-6-hydroxymethyldihydropteridine diphosphokinase [Steroidobacteraceae bacterium]|jgi:2-amino-4-hydroxy-6-hydroxymethyldihydropteridine diphosphokinase|nr:2-amino-4-hydroxy-6-hydroxymethyldihydropteridine diphosphokinase [Steroidobacteraceae bacterium]